MKRSGLAVLPPLLAAVLLGAVVQADAFGATDGPGDPAFGRQLAQELCGDCHVVSPDRAGSGYEPGPNLVERMREPGITEMALRSYLQTSHPIMPNIRLTRDQTDDIVAYLESLTQ